MEAHESYTRLLGLALRGGNLVTGSDATQAAAHAGTARLLLLSADASVRTCKDAAFWSERGNCLLIALPCDKATLGEALGRGTVAVAALTDAGLAAAVGERLAQFDSERYGAVAERLRVKTRRAAERRTARARARPAKRGDASARPDKDSKPDAKATPRKTAARPDKDAKPGAKGTPRKTGAARPHRDAKPDAKATPRKTAARPHRDSKSGAKATPRKTDAARKSAAPPKRDAKTRKN